MCTIAPWSSVHQAMVFCGSGSVWERSLTLFEMTHGLCSCHSEQSEESFSILRVMVIENEPLPVLWITVLPVFPSGAT
jgi:hypothetical protein